jgi:DNA-binding protein YbaB
VAVTDHRADVEQLLAEYRRSREQLATAHRALAAMSVTESSRDGAITVTVGAQGTLTGLSIHDETYRHYRPQRLADTIMQLTAAAAQRAAAQSERSLQPVLPPRVEASALLAGTADLRPEEIAPKVALPVEPDPRFFHGDEDDEPAHGWMQRTYGGDWR